MWEVTCFSGAELALQEEGSPDAQLGAQFRKAHAMKTSSGVSWGCRGGRLPLESSVSSCISEQTWRTRPSRPKDHRCACWADGRMTNGHSPGSESDGPGDKPPFIPGVWIHLHAPRCAAEPVLPSGLKGPSVSRGAAPWTSPDK